MVKVFQPKGTLKASDKDQTKIELAAEIMTELIKDGWNIELVLADSLDGESSQFLSKLDEYCGWEYSLPPTLIEYGFRQCQQELGWTDDRFTNFQHIQRWCGAGAAPPPVEILPLF